MSCWLHQASMKQVSAFTVTFKLSLLMQSNKRNKCLSCGIHTKLENTIFETTLQKLLGLYNKIQLLSATNTDTTGLNSPLICPSLKRQGRSEVNPLYRSVRKSKKKKRKV